MEVADQEFHSAYKVSDLKQHPDNPRRGNDVAVAESIEANGFYGAVIAQKSTGFVLAGNTRLRASIEEGAETVPTFMLDCDDETATRILLADNRLSDLAEYDNRVLLRLLDDVAEYEPELTGTGYDDLSLSLLRAAVQFDEPSPPPPPPEEGFPDINPDDMGTQFRCPSCQYEWSGAPKPGVATHEPDDS